jgi:hypothetical protein
MKIKEISFPIPLEDVENIYDDNIDVFVDLENGRSYTVIAGTCQNVLSLLNQENSNFLPPGEPMILVRKLTMEVSIKIFWFSTSIFFCSSADSYDSL